MSIPDDITPRCAEAERILSGELDGLLNHLENAITARRLKRADDQGIRVGASITFMPSCPEPHLRGITQRIQQVAPHTVVTADCSIPHQWFDKDYVIVKGW